MNNAKSKWIKIQTYSTAIFIHVHCCSDYESEHVIQTEKFSENNLIVHTAHVKLLHQTLSKHTIHAKTAKA